MRSVRSLDMIEALNQLSESDAAKQKERAMRQQLRRHEKLDIDSFFSSGKAAQKSGGDVDKQLMLYLKVRPRKLQPLSGRPSPVLSPTPTLDPNSIIASLHKPKPRKFQGNFRIYSDWDYHCSTQIKRESQNYRAKAMRANLSPGSYSNPFSPAGRQPGWGSETNLWPRP